MPSLDLHAPPARTRSLRSAAALLAAVSVSVSCSGSPPAATRHNAVLITVDSLRADRPGFLGGGVATPSMDALAAGGAVFASALTTSPQTLPSIASILTGLYPTRHGIRDDARARLGDGTPTIATVLRDGGWRTAAFAGTVDLHPKYGLDRGFDTYGEALADIPRPSVAPVTSVAAPRIADRAIEWLESVPAGERFFLWLNFYDPHFFYEPPSPIREAYAERPYDGEIALVDRELGRVTRWLAEHGHDADTVILLVGNHGEGLGEGEKFHGILLREPTVRVPLVLRPPAGARPAAPVRIDAPVSIADAAPTILEAAGAAVPSGLDGVSLAGAARGAGGADAARAIYFETMLPRTLFGWAPLRGVRVGSLKYVEAAAAGAATLHDLAADPGETRDLAATRPEDARRLAAETARIGGRFDAAPPALPAELIEGLRSIGLEAPEPVAATTVPSSKVSVGDAALQADLSLRRGMAQAAVFLLRDVLREDPGNYVALLDWSRVNVSARNFAEAQAALRRAQERYPGDGEIYHQLGHFVLATAARPEDQAKAKVLFETAVALAPLNEEALYDTACSVAAAAPERALDLLDAAVRAGFRDFRHMSRDRDLDPIRGTPRFAAITGGKAAASPVAPEGTAAPAAPGTR